MMPPFLKERLQKRESQGLIRKLQSTSGLVDLTSNDYFGFAKCSSHQINSSGGTGSRLLTGNSLFYEELEEKIGRFHRAENCLIYNSGYSANLGLLSSLGTPEVTFLYDLEIHASMIDGMQMSHAKRVPFRHNDLDSLEERLKRASPPVFVLIESVYSISGEIAPLLEIAYLCKHYGASLIVDEAHATGIYGDLGEGLVCHLGLEDLCFARVHTFSKALGAHGGCILGSSLLKKYLLNFSRPLIYTTALPHSMLAQIESNYERLKKEARSHQLILRKLMDSFCQKTSIEGTQSPIQPIPVTSVSGVRALSKKLQTRGFDVRPILPPTVARGKECLRIVFHSFNYEEEIDHLLEALS